MTASQPTEDDRIDSTKHYREVAFDLAVENNHLKQELEREKYHRKEQRRRAELLRERLDELEDELEELR